MEKVIWKFNFPIKEVFQIEMPKEAQVLAVQNQREQGTLWAACDPDAPKEVRKFTVIGTGHRFEDGGKSYIGTFQTDDGALVWHLFEIPIS